MNLIELNHLFVDDNFFYHSKYLGIVECIYYHEKPNYYSIKVYNKKNLYCIPSSYMMECYKNKLKYLRMSILRSKGISDLVHFTVISNLANVLKNGLLSRNILDNENFVYSYSDSIRLDNKLDYICNSITFPNYKMFFAKRQEDVNKKWVVLSIDSDILVDKFDTEFYRMNAASNDISKCRFNPCSNYALDDMFYPEDREPNLPSNYTTNPQAEVMIKDSISSSYIKSIHTNYYDDYVHYLANNSNLDYDSNSDLFKPRIDYRRW